MVASSRLRGLVLTVCCLAVSLSAFAGRHHDVDISTFSGGTGQSCDDWQVRINGEKALVSSETVDVAGSSLAVEAAKSGGVTVRGGNSRGFSVTLCRAASSAMGSSALSQITLRRSGDKLSVDGPSGEEWVAHLIVRAPAGASLRASATNGPVDVADFEGTLDLDANNGPISLERVAGTITATTTNGPLSLDGASGNVTLKATNGPVTVKLSGGAWMGQSLEASSVNGPLTLAVPRGFSSGVEIRAAGHAPLGCPAALCGAMVKSWDDDDDEQKIVRFGGATPVVRLSTENGPVSVKERD
ncbi:MAG: hypothetical protein NDJ92_04265 [Thermoanaerobaculia bacterium]|nr:hypothetical protein [Thermoanaerobaculia bacterium]